MLLKVSDVARQLNLSRSKVYELKHEIGFHQIGRSIRFSPDQVQRYLEQTAAQQERGNRLVKTRSPRPRRKAESTKAQWF
jgi:excisionase family DNA binding protein